MIKKFKASLKNNKFVVNLTTIGLYYYLRFVYLTSRVQFVFQSESEDEFHVIPAKAGIQKKIEKSYKRSNWIPWSSHGMTRDTSQIKQFLNHQGVIFAFWHNRVALSPVMFGRCKNIYALISSHRDGKVLSHIVPKFNCAVIEGSTNKNPLGSIKVIIQRLLENNNVIITPDGPRGPIYKINSAITNIAKKYNKKIIPVSCNCSGSYILKSWDKLIMPLPFSKIIIRVGAPLKLTDDKEQNDSNLEKALMMLTAPE